MAQNWIVNRPANLWLDDFYIEASTGWLGNWNDITGGLIPDMRIMRNISNCGKRLHEVLRVTPEYFKEERKGVDIPFPKELDLIKKAIREGIVSENPVIERDRDGIKTVDGINIQDLQKLLDGIEDMSEENLALLRQILASTRAIETLVGKDRLTDEDLERILSGLGVGTLPGLLDNLGDLSKANTDVLKDILTEVQTITRTLELEARELDFDVRLPAVFDKFPFSLPFDFYNIITLFVETPRTPAFEIPIDGRSIHKDFYFPISINLAEYNWIARIVRELFYIAFLVVLIYKTNNLIGRG